MNSEHCIHDHIERLGAAESPALLAQCAGCEALFVSYDALRAYFELAQSRQKDGRVRGSHPADALDVFVREAGGGHHDLHRVLNESESERAMEILVRRGIDVPPLTENDDES